MARGPRALRPVENRPTAHGARARWRTWRGCLRGQRATRSTPRRWPRLFFTDTAPGRRLRLRDVVTTVSAPVPRDPRALRPVENQPTAHGARARWRTWRGCLCGQRATRSTPRRWPRLLFTDTAPGRRLRLRSVVPLRSTPVARGPRALRPVENRPTAHGARARWRTWRGCLRGQRATRSTPRRWPRLFFTDTTPGRRLRLRNVVTCVRAPVARDPRALRPVENRPTAHGARARWRTWRGCLRGQRATRSTPRRWPRLFFTDTAPGRRLRLRNARDHSVRAPVARGPRALRPVENRPTAHGARARWRTWRGCLRGQRATRSIPRRWPRLFFTDTAPGRRLRLRTS